MELLAGNADHASPVRYRKKRFRGHKRSYSADLIKDASALFELPAAPTSLLQPQPQQQTGNINLSLSQSLCLMDLKDRWFRERGETAPPPYKRRSVDGEGTQ